MIKALPNHEIVCEQIVKQRAQLLPLTLIENIASLGCFDAGTGKAVAGALTMARILNSTLDVDDDFARRAHKKVLDSLLDLAERSRPAFHDADEKLSAYTGIPAKKRGVPPLGIEI